MDDYSLPSNNNTYLYNPYFQEPYFRGHAFYPVFELMQNSQNITLKIIEFDHMVWTDWYNTRVRSENFLRVTFPPTLNSAFSNWRMKQCLNQLVLDARNKIQPYLPKPDQLSSSVLNRKIIDIRNEARIGFWSCARKTPYYRTIYQQKDEIRVDFLYRLFYYGGAAPGYRRMEILPG